MTKTSSNSLCLTVPRSHSLRDLAVVAFLAVVLGAFVAQLPSAPPSTRNTEAAVARCLGPFSPA